MIKQFFMIAKILSVNREGHSALIWELIPHYKTFLWDESTAINKAACDSLYQVESLLNEKDKFEAIFPIILDLAHDEEEELRSLSLTLMAHFASKIERNLVEKILVAELNSLSNDEAL